MTAKTTDGGSGKPPFIDLQRLSKHFGDFVAVDSVDLQIYRGELFSILGGSGCGKTTLLRMLAGFETPTAGRILLDGLDITDLPPYRRPLNMMFQSYAVFPHMTVEKNIAYGLRKERLPDAEVRSRVSEMLSLVKLQDFARRKPNQLSGGERQRVALARALVKKPKVLLLDEPLAALDKKLREHTQFELMNIQDRLGITFIVVTHDQEEAMILSTRIAVMEKGRFEQIGPPKEVYEFPKNRFVADFIGTINVFEGIVADSSEGRVLIESPDAGITMPALCDEPPPRGRRVCVAVRPEKIFISRQATNSSEDTQLSGIVEDYGYFGNLSLYRIRLPGGKIVQVSAPNHARSRDRSIEWDEVVYICWRPRSAVLLED